MIFQLIVFICYIGFAVANTDSITPAKEPAFELDRVSRDSRDSKEVTSELQNAFKKELSRSFIGADIHLDQDIRWISGNEKSLPSDYTVSLAGDDSRGSAHFLISGLDVNNTAECWVKFSAWTDANVATKRVHPGDILVSEMFHKQKIDISKGAAYAYRGVLPILEIDFTKLEAIQTILEGQFLTTPAVRKIPDIRRGDSVRVHLVSEGMVLSTLGIAEEAGYISHQVRVAAGKNKKDLLGQLLPGGIVEVKL